MQVETLMSLLNSPNSIMFPATLFPLICRRILITVLYACMQELLSLHHGQLPRKEARRAVS